MFLRFEGYRTWSVVNIFFNIQTNGKNPTAGFHTGFGTCCYSGGMGHTVSESTIVGNIPTSSSTAASNPKRQIAAFSGC